ncbi:MAG: glycosyltransferase [Candidatus Falkowbacteria bacterium]
MNILFINKGDTGGGGYKVVWDLATELVGLGHTVNMFVQDKKTTSDIVKIIPFSRWRYFLSHLFGTDLDFFKTDFILQSNEFKKADIVHVNNIHSHYFNLKTFGKMCAAKPVVWTFHDLWPVTSYCPHPISKSVFWGFYLCPTFSTRSLFKKINQLYLIFRKRVLYRRIKFNIVTPSLYMRRMLDSTVVRRMPQDMIYNGIDTDIFKPKDKTKTRIQLNLPADKKIFIFVANKGKSNSWKGWQYFNQLADYFSDQKEVLFICIGSGSDQNRSNIRFVDFVDDGSVLSSYYSAADALIFCSLAESFGLVVTEAMSCGVPVVAFPVGIVPEAIEHKTNGFVADYQNVPSLIEGVKYIMTMPANDLEAMKTANREKVLAKFSKKIMVDSYQELYKRVLK